MPLSRDILHTTAAAMAAFEKLSPSAQMMEIWLNGRETNGHVADLIVRVDAMEPKVDRHERWIISAAAILALAIFGGPFVFWGLEHVQIQ